MREARVLVHANKNFTFKMLVVCGLLAFEPGKKVPLPVGANEATDKDNNHGDR